MEQYEFIVKLNLNDYRAFNFHHSYGSNSLIIKVMPILIAILYPVLVFMYLSKPDRILLAILVIAGVGILASILLVITIYFYSKKVFDSDKYLQEAQLFQINDKEINLRSKSTISTYLWDELYKCVENGSYFFIYIANIKAIIIPKKQLTHSQIGFISEMCNEATVKELENQYNV